MRKDLEIGWFGYSLIGLFTLTALIAFVRALVMTFTNGTTEDWISIGVSIGVGGIGLLLSYWTGRLVVWVVSLLDVPREF
jgi:hypothetical protein